MGTAWVENHRRVTTIGTAVSLLLTLAVGISMMVTPWWKQVTRNTYIAYFPNTNGVYTGDEIRILGVAVGTIEQDRTAAQRGEGHVHRRVAVLVAGRRQGGDPVPVTGHIASDPTRPGLLRRPETG